MGLLTLCDRAVMAEVEDACITSDSGIW